MAWVAFLQLLANQHVHLTKVTSLETFQAFPDALYLLPVRLSPLNRSNGSQASRLDLNDGPE